MSAEVSRITLLWHFEFREPLCCAQRRLWPEYKFSEKWREERKPSLGAAISRGKELHLQQLCFVPSLDSGICVCLWGGVCVRLPAKNAPGCVHLCICSVFTKGEGLSAFNYSTVKDLTCPFQSLSLHRPWYIIERLFLKKADQRGRLIPPLHGQHR